jgi:hypothetical protein
MAPWTSKNDRICPNKLGVNRLEETITAAMRVMRHTDKADVRAVYVLAGRRPTYDELCRLRQQMGSLSMTVTGDGCVAIRRPFEPEIDTSGTIEWHQVMRPLERSHTISVRWLRRQAVAWSAGFVGLNEGVR